MSQVVGDFFWGPGMGERAKGVLIAASSLRV